MSKRSRWLYMERAMCKYWSATNLSIADMSLKLSLPEGAPGFRSAFFVSTVSDSTEAT